MSCSPAHAPRSRRSIAAAISSGNWSGVQANAGTPSAANAGGVVVVVGRARPRRTAPAGTTTVHAARRIEPGARCSSSLAVAALDTGR